MAVTQVIPATRYTDIVKNPEKDVGSQFRYPSKISSHHNLHGIIMKDTKS